MVCLALGRKSLPPSPSSQQACIQVRIQILLWVQTHARSCDPTGYGSLGNSPFLSAYSSLLGEGSKRLHLPAVVPSGPAPSLSLSSFGKSILPRWLASAAPGSDCHSSYNPFFSFLLWRPRVTLTSHSAIPTARPSCAFSVWLFSMPRRQDMCALSFQGFPTPRSW